MKLATNLNVVKLKTIRHMTSKNAASFYVRSGFKINKNNPYFAKADEIVPVMKMTY